MDSKEIITAYVKGMNRQGMPVYGRYVEGTMEPLLPYFLGDLIYTIFTKHIGPLELKREGKRAKNTWQTAYRHFNHSFFNCFNQEQTDYVIDMMDDFQSYAYNEIEILRLHILDCIPESIPEGEHQLVSYMLLEKILIAGAMTSYSEIFFIPKRRMVVAGNEVNPTEKKAENPHLTAMWRATNPLILSLYPQLDGHSSDNMQKVYDAWNTFVSKMMKFLNKHYDGDDK